jgi:hypothetical protein
MMATLPHYGFIRPASVSKGSRSVAPFRDHTRSHHADQPSAVHRMLFTIGLSTLMWLAILMVVLAIF